MTTQQRLEHLRSFEGLRVSLALKDGTRIDDCQLVGAGRAGSSSIWVYVNGADVFVPLRSVRDIWESVGQSRRVA